ncbi:MAG: chlorite dismutase family protein [Leptolyngbya sp.]|nr:chlorite dismutase family protein [Candidatus Melainabacteria bacterium]
MKKITSFVGGTSGAWRILSMETVAGEPLSLATHLDILDSNLSENFSGNWQLRGSRSYERYTNHEEHEQLIQKSPPLGRPEANSAALIPIQKTDLWWQLSQDERRKIFEEESHHIEIGMAYLPAIARRLYHSKDLGEPFDFLTWFEFDSKDKLAFDKLLKELRQSKEWTYVQREIDIRLVRS